MDQDPEADPDLVIFDSDLQDGFFAYYFLKVHLHHFSKIKSHKEVTKQYLDINVFLTIFA
jgi:hypothetical protein